MSSSDPWVEDWHPNYGESYSEGYGFAIHNEFEALPDTHNALVI